MARRSTFTELAALQVYTSMFIMQTYNTVFFWEGGEKSVPL